MERLRKAMERARAERRQRLTLQSPGITQPSPAPTTCSRKPLKPCYEESAGAAPRHLSEHRDRPAFTTPRQLSGRNTLRLADSPEPIEVEPDVAAIYRFLSAQILERVRTGALRTLAVTSPGQGDGKTTTVLNLATALARDTDQHVLLVDFDLKHPSIGRHVTHPGAPGVIDCLVGDVEFEDTLVDPGIERLRILPGGTPIRYAPALNVSARLAQLIDDLKRHVPDRLILIDMPSLFDGDEAGGILPHVDAVLLVVADGRVSRQALVEAQVRLGERCIGMVLNKSGWP